MFAIVALGSKQYRVSPGDVLELDLMDAQANDEVVLDQVLMLEQDGELSVGTPVVEGARAVVTVLGETRGPKIRVFRYKSKKNYRRRMGHRQRYTQVRVERIEA